MTSTLSSTQTLELLKLLEKRFVKHSGRHPGISWEQVEARLKQLPDKVWALSEMERTGGEPDVVGRDAVTGEFLFFDCSPQSPKGRVSVCYDRAALESRKEHPPKHSAIELAREMGVELLTETQYRTLQTLGEFDTKTSSWIQTPTDIRKLGGALFCDRRYDHVFVYHNGAQSYYNVRGFRACLRV